MKEINEYLRQDFSELGKDFLFEDKTFDSCTFSSCDFSSREFLKTRFIDCKFLNCNFSLSRFSLSRFQNVSFEGCKILGVNFSELDSFLLKMTFSESIIKDSYFTDLKMQKTCFNSCFIISSEFSGVDLSYSDFSFTDFKDSYFRKCNISSCNFSSSKNYSIDPTTNEISGSKFGVPEVLGLLESFDIKIE